MNIKTGNWKDLINDQPFTRKDIITIQDPNNAMKFNLSSFHHIKNNIRVEDEGSSERVSFTINIFYFCKLYMNTMFFRDRERKKQSKCKIKNRIGGDQRDPGGIGERLQAGKE